MISKKPSNTFSGFSNITHSSNYIFANFGIKKKTKTFTKWEPEYTRPGEDNC